MAFSKRTLSIVTVVLIVALLGGGIYLRLRPENAEAEETGAQADTTEAMGPTSASQQFSTDIPQPVEGAEVVRDTLWISVTAAGVAEANRRATLKAQVDGVVQSIPVRENTAVSAGRAVLQIDSTELSLAVADARAGLLEAEANFQQLTLFDDEMIEDEEVRRRREAIARARSGLDAAEVRLQQEQLRLARSTVRAPFGGRVADLLVVSGQHVTAGTDLMTVVDANPVRVEVQVLEAELGALREGRRATVTFAGFPGQTFEGRVASINPVVNPESRTGRVTVLLPNPTGMIRPGMYARVTVEAEEFPDRLLVPREAILERGGRTMLFVFETEEDGQTGQAMWRYVTTGRENDSLVEIVPSDEGIVEPGEVVLVDGHHYLAHGVDVRLVEDVAAAGGRPGG